MSMIGGIDLNGEDDQDGEQESQNENNKASCVQRARRQPLQDISVSVVSPNISYFGSLVNLLLDLVFCIVAWLTHALWHTNTKKKTPSYPPTFVYICKHDGKKNGQKKLSSFTPITL